MFFLNQKDLEIVTVRGKKQKKPFIRRLTVQKLHHARKEDGEGGGEKKKERCKLSFQGLVCVRGLRLGIRTVSLCAVGSFN